MVEARTEKERAERAAALERKKRREHQLYLDHLPLMKELDDHLANAADIAKRIRLSYKRLHSMLDEYFRPAVDEDDEDDD